MRRRATATEKRDWMAKVERFQERADYVLRTHDVTQVELSALWDEFWAISRAGGDAYGLIERAASFDLAYKERLTWAYRRLNSDPYSFYDGLSESRKAEWHAQLGGPARYREYRYTTDIGCLEIMLGAGIRVGIHNGCGDGSYALKVFDSGEDFQRRFISKPYYAAAPLVLWVEKEATASVDGDAPCVLSAGRWAAYVVRRAGGKMCLVKEGEK